MNTEKKKTDLVEGIITDLEHQLENKEKEIDKLRKEIVDYKGQVAFLEDQLKRDRHELDEESNEISIMQTNEIKEGDDTSNEL